MKSSFLSEKTQSRTVQCQICLRRCRRLPSESLTLKAISILLELLGDLPGFLDLPWQVSEGDKMPGGLYKNAAVIAPHLQSWAGAIVMQRRFQKILWVLFSKTDLCKHPSHLGGGDLIKQDNWKQVLPLKFFEKRLCAFVFYLVSICHVKKTVLHPHTSPFWHHFGWVSRLTLVLVGHPDSV